MTGRGIGLNRFAKNAAVAIFLAAAASCVRADLVIVQKVEGGAQSGEMTMKIKGDKARTDFSPAASAIIDAATGDVITLRHDRKSFIRITAAAAKELAQRMKKTEAENGGDTPARPQLRP